MTTIRTAVLAILLTAPAATAADLTKAPPPVPAASSASGAPSWTGFHLGIGGGYSWLAGEIPESLFTAGKTEAASGGVAGVFAGFDHQFENRMVLGVEASYDYNWNDNDYTVTSPFPVLNGQRVTFGTEWRASVEGRVGYAWQHALLYASGGFASSRLEGSFSLTGKDYHETMNGWTVGLGVDYTFTDHLFGRLKASYSDYGHTDLITQATGLPGLPEAKLTQASLTAGIGFKF